MSISESLTGRRSGVTLMNTDKLPGVEQMMESQQQCPGDGDIIWWLRRPPGDGHIINGNKI